MCCVASPCCPVAKVSVINVALLCCLFDLACFFLPSFFISHVHAVLLCLVVCLTLLASFFLPSSSLINMYMYSLCNNPDCLSDLTEKEYEFFPSDALFPRGVSTVPKHLLDDIVKNYREMKEYCKVRTRTLCCMASVIFQARRLV